MNTIVFLIPQKKTYFCPTNYKVIDIFSGCGGMSWGLHKAGFEVIAALDSWDIALKTFKINHPEAAIFNGDIRAISPLAVMEKLDLQRGELDCLVGGPPCQGFSKNVPAAYRFFDDERNQLFSEKAHQIGNAVPSLFMYHLAKNIKECLKVSVDSTGIAKAAFTPLTYFCFFKLKRVDNFSGKWKNA